MVPLSMNFNWHAREKFGEIAWIYLLGIDLARIDFSPQYRLFIKAHFTCIQLTCLLLRICYSSSTITTTTNNMPGIAVQWYILSADINRILLVSDVRCFCGLSIYTDTYIAYFIGASTASEHTALYTYIPEDGFLIPQLGNRLSIETIKPL